MSASASLRAYAAFRIDERVLQGASALSSVAELLEDVHALSVTGFPGKAFNETDTAVVNLLQDALRSAAVDLVPITDLAISEGKRGLIQDAREVAGGDSSARVTGFNDMAGLAEMKNGFYSNLPVRCRLHNTHFPPVEIHTHQHCDATGSMESANAFGRDGKQSTFTD